ncbi:MAG: sigma 54-interacting transcriptional regulator [Blastocatellia bacterium]
MIPKLIGIAGPYDGRSYQIHQKVTAIGRKPGNDLIIGDRLISREHCQISMVVENGGPRCLLTDLKSANGTYVNDLPVGERLLVNGDQIRIGSTSLLFLCHEEGEEGEKANSIKYDDASIEQLPTIAIDPKRARYLESGSVPAERAVEQGLPIETRKLLQMAMEFIVVREMDPLEERIREFLDDRVPAEFGALLIFEESALGDTAWERALQWHGAGAAAGGSRGSGGFRISRSALRRVGTERHAVLINFPLDDEASQLAESVAQSGIRSLMVAPLLRNDRLLGALYLSQSNPAIRFSQEHLELTMAIAELAAKSLENILEFKQIEDDKARLQEALYFDREMIGETAPMREVKDFIARAAATTATVLIQGETGTGKELVAQALHLNSPRKGHPFIAINCANLTEGLFESELFGYERGAFTGALGTRKGKLELANGGTLFLDEIGEFPPHLQAKLLRALQEREIERLGGAKPIKLDFRVIAATNKDLDQAMAVNSFRNDLFYRLNAVRIVLPPLRDRRDDIPLIATYFINHYAQRHRSRVIGLSRAARERLINYDWPGNVRELQNVIENAVIFSETELIHPEDLPDKLFETREHAPTTTSAASPILIQEVLPYREALREARKQILLHTFKVAGGDHQAAARLLDIHPNNLHRELRNMKLKSLVKRQP